MVSEPSREASEPPFQEPPEPFRYSVTRKADLARLEVFGDLDLETVPRLQAGIAAARSDGVQRLIIDLRGLDFMDSTGLRCLLECHTAARRDDVSLWLVPGPPDVQRVFEITQTHRSLPFIAV